MSATTGPTQKGEASSRPFGRGSLVRFLVGRCLWALIPAIASGALYIVRTYMEDETLRKELPGYREYARRTRYRLLPGVW